MRTSSTASYAEVEATQRSLVWIWGSGFSVCFMIMLILTVAGTFGEGTQEAWSWFLPTLLPTFGMAMSAAITRADQKAVRTVPRFVAQLSRVVSTAYVLLVLVTLIVWPLTGNGPLAWFRTSGLWLGPIQGVIGGVLAVFLTRQKPQHQ